jgi:hypothetical protein
VHRSQQGGRGSLLGIEHDLDAGPFRPPDPHLAHHHRRRFEATVRSGNQNLRLVLGHLDGNTTTPREKVAEVNEQGWVADADAHGERRSGPFTDAERGEGRS